MLSYEEKLQNQISMLINTSVQVTFQERKNILPQKFLILFAAF
jgi:hypothetical protein